MQQIKLPCMQRQIKLPVATLAHGSYCESVKYISTNLTFAPFNAPYNPLRQVGPKIW